MKVQVNQDGTFVVQMTESEIIHLKHACWDMSAILLMKDKPNADRAARLTEMAREMARACNAYWDSLPGLLDAA